MTWSINECARLAAEKQFTAITEGPYGPHVRVRSTPAAPPSSDLVVEWKDKNGAWHEHWRTNDMSNDYAYAEARDAAIRLRVSIKEGEFHEDCFPHHRP